MPTDESHKNVFIKDAYDIVFSRDFFDSIQQKCNYEILLSLVSVFTCSLSVTDGVICDEIFSKVTHYVGCMCYAAYFIVYPHPEGRKKRD